MTQKHAYGISTQIGLPYEEAISKVTEILKQEGFGVLTEIDVKATLKKKLDADFRKHIILGACNPTLAHRALQAEPELGLLLPCNVIVYEAGENQSVASVIDPLMMVGVTGNTELESTADEANQQLTQAIECFTDPGRE